MIVDTSAIIAVLRQERMATALVEALANNQGTLRMSAATLLEAGMVVSPSNSGPGQQQLDLFISDHGIECQPFTESQARIAIEAHLTYGKGSGHKARLNFGDCMTYALAKESGEPLLFIGNDFAQTDIESALAV